MVGTHARTVEALPKVQSFDYKDVAAAPEQVVEAIRLAGGVIIRNFVDFETLDIIEAEVRPHLVDIPDDLVDVPAAEKEQHELSRDGVFNTTFFPNRSRRLFGMISKSTTSTKLLLDPLYQEVCRRFLRSYHTSYIGEGAEPEYHVSEPKVNNSIAFSIMPGASAQPLHRDDSPHHIHNEAVDVYPELEKTHRDSCLGLFVAGMKTTKENGATRFIPGSHLWDHHEPPKEALAVYAELERGDAFMMLGNCYHAGSANTSKSTERLIFSAFYVRGFLMPEENQSLAIPIEVAATWPLEMQKHVGFGLSQPVSGMVDGRDPIWVMEEYLASKKAKEDAEVKA
ncbi:hypothetical protein MNV49_001239 [Pseudohyphozyma bogoriensis]|nr:hypothetical protein MNV49_001239 [Pseudohyphozyma bogoriensis]